MDGNSSDDELTALARASPARSHVSRQQARDVWEELFGTVRTLGITVELSLQALTPDTVLQSGEKVRQ
jgi:hypothetical protein